jgi:hypothetical protein
MEWLSLTNLLQIIVGFGLLNVWLVRRRSALALSAAIVALR